MSSILVDDSSQSRELWTLRRWIGACVLLAALILVAYGPTLSHGFVWDDHEQIIDNPHLRQWSSLGELWQHDVLTLSRSDGESRSNYYRPLFFTQYLVYFQLFGLNTVAWHALALLQHWLACLAVLLFLRVVGLRYGPALAIAGLFAVHPVHGESVSWVAAAFNDPPAASFLLLGLTAHLCWRRRGNVLWLAAASLCYAGALTLKEAALSMLFLVPLIDCIADHPRKPWRRLSMVLPFWLLLGISFLWESASSWPWILEYPFRVLPLQLLVVLGLGALSLRWLKRGSEQESLQAPFASYAPYIAVTLVYFAVRKAAIFTALGVYSGGLTPIDLIPSAAKLILFYGKTLIWPWGLSPSYPLRLNPGWNPTAVTETLLLLALLGLLLWAMRRFPTIALATLWTAACTLPALNVLSFRPQYLVHQRYLYLGSLGICGLAVWATYRWLRQPLVRTLLLLGLLLMGTASNLFHNRFWASDEALWTRISQVDPANAAAFDWLGHNALQASRVDEAERLFRRSLEAAPDSPYGLCNLGTLLYTQRKDAAQALPYLQRGAGAFRTPQYPEQLPAAFNCALNLANARATSGDRTVAIDELFELVDRFPREPRASRNLAILLVQQKRLGEAELALRQAVEHHPREEQLQKMLRDVERWKANP